MREGDGQGPGDRGTEVRSWSQRDRRCPKQSFTDPGCSNFDATPIDVQHTCTKCYSVSRTQRNNLLCRLLITCWGKKFLFILEIKNYIWVEKSLNKIHRNRICIKEGNYNILLQKVREVLNKYHAPRWKK